MTVAGTERPPPSQDIIALVSVNEHANKNKNSRKLNFPGTCWLFCVSSRTRQGNLAVVLATSNNSDLVWSNSCGRLYHIISK